jgi:hypothetical protein
MEEQGVSAAVADHEVDDDLAFQDHQRQLQGTGNSKRSALSAFLGLLLQENAALAEVELAVTLVSDNAASLPEQYTLSRNLTEPRNSSSQSSIPRLSRWESHVVRATPAVVERKPAAWRASPARPQRRSSFEVDRANDKLLPNEPRSEDSCRRALSQSVSQLPSFKPGEAQQLEQKTLPPRVPIRRNSGRVHSPPPEGRPHHSRSKLQDDVNDESTSTRFGDESTSFHLELSESEAFHDVEYPTGGQQMVKDMKTIWVDAKLDEPPSHQRTSLRDMQKFRRPASSPSPTQNPRRHGNSTNHRKPRRAASLTDDGLPVLETFPTQPPHLRVLSQQLGSRHLRENESSDGSISSTQTNTAPSHDSSASAQVDVLTKVASTKLIPVRQSCDLGAMKLEVKNIDTPTVEAAFKTTLRTRRKQKVVKSVNSETS